MKLLRVPQLWWTALRGPRAAPSAPGCPRRSRTPWARLRGLMAAGSFRSAATGTGVLPRVDGNTVSRTALRGFRPQVTLVGFLPVREGESSNPIPLLQRRASRLPAPRSRLLRPDTIRRMAAPRLVIRRPRGIGRLWVLRGLQAEPAPDRILLASRAHHAGAWCFGASRFACGRGMGGGGIALSLPAGARSSARGASSCMHSDNCLSPIASEHPAGGPSRHR